MQSVSELNLVIPPFAKVLTRACERMSRNDYLLTAALLFQCVSVATKYELFKEIDALDILDVADFYDRYKFRYIPHPYWEVQPFLSKAHYDVFLDGVKIALWKRQYNSFLHSAQSSPEPGAEGAIFEALGFSAAEYEEYASDAESTARRASMVVSHDSLLPHFTILPDLDIPLGSADIREDHKHFDRIWDLAYKDPHIPEHKAESV